MPLEYLNVDSKNIKEIINSGALKDFKKEQECILNIDEIKCVLEDGFAIDKDGYKKPETKAQMILSDLPSSDIEEIVFYVDSLVEYINKKFGEKLVDTPQNKEILDKISNTIINLVLVHELMHVYQVKKGILNKEVIDLYENTRYEDIPYEREVIDLSSMVISRYGEFEAEVVKIVNSNELVSTKNIDRLIELYKK